MNRPSSDFLQLCAAVRDETATPEQIARLEAMLANDRDAQRFYTRFVEVNVLLESYDQITSPFGGAAAAAEPVRGGIFRNPRINRWFAIAAGVAVVASAYLGVRWSTSTPAAVRETPASIATPVAVVEDSEGCVLIPPVGAQTEVRKGHYVRIGDIIATQRGGRAVIRALGEETLFILTSETRLWLGQVGSSKIVNLHAGNIFCDVVGQKHGARWRIVTAEGETTVLGTRLAVNSTPLGTNIAVTKGRVRVTARESRDSVEARAGFSVRLTRSEVALSPLPPGVPPRVVSLSLVNADTGEDIPGFATLADGAIISLAALPTSRINIRANCEPQIVSAVRFNVSGKDSSGEQLQLSHGDTPAFPNHTEVTFPYFAAGDPRTGYHTTIMPPYPWIPPVGRYVIVAIPYGEKRVEGTRGDPMTVHFEVAD